MGTRKIPTSWDDGLTTVRYTVRKGGSHHYERSMQVEPDAPFRILVANFTKTPKYLLKNQVVATLLPHPTDVTPSNIQLHEFLGIAEYDPELLMLEPAPPGAHADTAKLSGEDTEYLKEAENKPQSVDDVDLSNLDVKYSARARALLNKYSSMWDGSLGEMNITKHAIELAPGSRPFAQPP